MIDISQPELAQISCRNSLGMISYVNDHIGENALSELFQGILTGNTLTSTNYQYLGSPLTLDYFKDENNWYSNEINLKIFNNLSKMGIDAFKTGRYAISSAEKTKNIATIAYLQMLGPEKTIKKINKLNSIYNRTKTATVTTLENSSATIKLSYNCPHNSQVTRQNIGAYTGILELMGLRSVVHNVISDDFSQSNETIIEFSWQSSSRLSQLKWLISKKIASLFCKSYLQSEAVIDDYHKSIVISFENEITEKEIQRQKSETYYNQLITEQEKREQKLNHLVEEKTAQLAQSIKDKEKLFENFSHELKTPLTLIIGPIEQLLKQELPSDILQQLNGVNSNAHRLFDLVTTLLNFAELKVNRNKIIATNIYSCTTYIINSLKPLAETKNCQISLQYQCSKDLTLQLQAQTWELLLSNLLTNAIKHGEINNTIVILIKQNKQQLSLTVSDNNIPLSEQKQQNIRERFNINESHTQGHGLGLAIVDELATNHKGTFKVNIDENGNSFTVALPLTLCSTTELKTRKATPKATLCDASPLRSQQKAQSTDQASILLVEDNIELADFLKSSLGAFFKVTHCVNGRDAMQQLNKQLFDLIVSDVMMPVMDGFEFCQQVKTNETLQHIPLILLTAKSNLASQKQGLALQADDYIGKPFNTDILIQKMINIINTYQAHAKKIKHYLLSSEYSQLTNEKVNTKQDKQTLFLQQIQRGLKQYYQNAEIKAGDIAKHFPMSEKSLNRKLQATTGASLSELLREYRLNQAKNLLEQGVTIKETCFGCGFSSNSYFGRCFKQYFGLTPQQYQQQVNNNKPKQDTCLQAVKTD